MKKLISIALYGLYAFIKNQLLSYLFLTTSFVFFDFERPAVLFFTEYLELWECLSFWHISAEICSGKRNSSTEGGCR